MIKLRKKPLGSLELVMNVYAFADSEAMMMVVKDELLSSFRLWLCSDCCAAEAREWEYVVYVMSIDVVCLISSNPCQ